MKREFHAQLDIVNRPGHIQKGAVSFLLGAATAPPTETPDFAEVVDPLARVDLLAQALLTQDKDYARAGSRHDGGGLPQLYRSQAFQDALAARRRQMAALGLLPALPDLAILPAGSFAVHFTFTLCTPYISKDDVGLHILDNPVRKDRVFGLPMIAATGWKGALRAALRQAKGWDDDHSDLLRLCGSARDDETGQAGRLYFYPTFFTQLGLEVINPHDRRFNAGKQPIYFESVPAGAQGDFALLYVPTDCAGDDAAETRRQAVADLTLVTEGIETLMTRTGFGAKTSSGYGLAQELLKDSALTLRAANLQVGSTPSPGTTTVLAEALPRYLEAPGQLRAEYRNPDGSFRQRPDAELKAMNKTARQLYDKAQAWWEREGSALRKQDSQPPAHKAAPTERVELEWPTWSFATFDQLVQQSQQIAEQLAAGGAP